MNRPCHNLKAAANRLAGLLASQEGREVLGALARFDTRPAPSNNQPIPQTTRVGIWEKTTKRGETVFVRKVGDEPWSLWAQIGTIALRPQARRVLFLGESVARGYFYDPYFNPAQALQTILRALSGAEDIDVVDLARVGIERNQMLELVASSMVLDPAAIVIFAGNNWHPTLSLSASETAETADCLRREGSWQAVKTFMEDRLRSQVREFLDQVARIASERNIPVLYIIPEFNLGDWRDCGSPPPLFDSVHNRDWIAARSQLAELEQAGRWEEIDDLAQRMAFLDVGTSPLSLHFRADRALQNGDYPSARTLLEMARDAGCSLPLVESPRCYSGVQETIRHENGRYGYHVVDLPVCFESYLQGSLPDRRLFNDYCHLTVEGIRVAMAATAKALQPLLRLLPLSDAELMGRVPGPGPAITAEAHFLAAVHNANWGQPPRIVEYHCRAALQHSQDVSELMELYLDSHIRREPASMCASFNKAIERQSLSATNILFAPPRRRKALNLAIVNGMVNALVACKPEKGTETAYLLKLEHAVNKGTVDLLERRYCATTFANLEAKWEEHWAFYRAFDTTSQFTLIADGRQRVTLHLVYRTKMAADFQPVAIKINGANIADMPVSQYWTHYQTEADICDGVNSVALQWPAVQWCREERIRKAAASLEAGAGGGKAETEIMPAIYPVYGELYCFRAAPISH